VDNFPRITVLRYIHPYSGGDSKVALDLLRLHTISLSDYDPFPTTLKQNMYSDFRSQWKDFLEPENTYVKLVMQENQENAWLPHHLSSDTTQGCIDRLLSLFRLLFKERSILFGS
jgi:hypothetical protein